MIKLIKITIATTAALIIGALVVPSTVLNSDIEFRNPKTTMPYVITPRKKQYSIGSKKKKRLKIFLFVILQNLSRT
jgi:hypothetical protein